MRVCPDCQRQYDDDVDACPDDGEALVDIEPESAPAGAAAPADRTSMIDLEALEARRAAQRAEDGEEALDEPADDQTPPPDGPLEEDRDATGTLNRSRLHKRRDPTQLPPDDDEASQHTQRSKLSKMGKTGLSRTGARGGKTGVSRAGYTRRGTRGGTHAGTHAGTQGVGRTKGGTRGGTKMTRVVGADTGLAGETRHTRLPGVDSPPVSATKAALLAVALLVVFLTTIVYIVRNRPVLTVTTVPPGAAVRLDGVVVGDAPVQKRVWVGAHTLELDLNGYVPFKEVVDVPVGGLPFLQPLQKEPPPQPKPPQAREVANDLTLAALRLLEQGDLDGALEKVEAALRLVPDHKEALAAREKILAAIAKRDAGRAQDAASAAHAARVLAAQAATREGQRLYEANQTSPARDKLYEALRLDPSAPEPHRTLARIYNKEEATDKVRYHLERYLALGGADGDFKVREWLKTHPK